MSPAELQRLIDNPFIGEDWLPIAEALLALHQSKNFNRVLIHVYGKNYLREFNRGGPTLRVHYLSDGTVLFEAAANNDIKPGLSHEDYELMEALDFTVPRTNDGNYALVKDSQAAHSNTRFYRLFDADVDPVLLVELTLTSLSMVYKVLPTDPHSYGYIDGQHEFVHGLGLLERYGVTEHSANAATFGLKGSQPNRPKYEDAEEQSND